MNDLEASTGATLTMKEVAAVLEIDPRAVTKAMRTTDPIVRPRDPETSWLAPNTSVRVGRGG